MPAVFKREFRAYFYTPLGYVFIGAYHLLTGFFFFNYNLYGNSSDMRALFDVLFTVTLFLIPILTMRLMSEDRKMKTDQILLMSPVTSAGVVCGKFFAALCVYLLAMSGTLADSLILEIYGAPEWPLVAGHFSGLLLLGCCLIAIGLFISALTENQIVAAIGGFCAGLLLMLLDSVAPLVSAAGVSSVLKGISFRLRYQPFTLGIFGLDNIVFFASVCVFFVFLAVEQFEKRRWA